MKIALVIKLDKKTEKKIQLLKNFFKINTSKCLYLDDFPHLTLISTNVQLNLRELRKMNLCIHDKNIKIEISKPEIFGTDLLTNGKTFFFKVKKNKKLFNLQVFTSNFLQKYVKKNKIINLFKKNTDEFKSLMKYGFPFVGKHWIPHVSICSVLDAKINQKVYTKFLKTKINSIFYCNELYLCTVKKKGLKKIKKIKFLN